MNRASALRIIHGKRAEYYASDPVAFAQSVVDFELDEYQRSALTWRGKRLLLNCTRQWGKSTVIALYALWVALYTPGALVLLVSPTLRQSLELFDKVTHYRKRMAGAPELIEDNKISCRWANESRIVALPANSGGIRGYSAPTLIIQDEAAFVPDELEAALIPMLLSSKGQMIKMSSPFGKRGHFYEAWAQGGSLYDRVEVRIDQVARFDAETIALARRELGEWRFRQECMCEFVDTLDAVFTHEQVMRAMSSAVQPLELEAA